MDQREQVYRQLIFELQKVSFALVELQLYLDTHEPDPQAVQDFNRLSDLQNQIRQRYEQEFGPLDGFGLSNYNYPHGWVENPWPWEL